MTWRTSKGNRVLGNAEGKLFAEAIALLIDSDVGIGPGQGPNYGIPLINGPFQRLANPQKYTVLLEVATALLTPTCTVPTLNAVNESAVGYVYTFIKSQMFDMEDGIESWGQGIMNALVETLGPEEVAEHQGDGYFPILRNEPGADNYEDGWRQK